METDLHNFVFSALVCPSFANRFWKDCPTKPRAPTSIVHRRGIRPISQTWRTRSMCMYLVSLRILAASIPSSAGQVSSIIKTFFKSTDQITISGLCSVHKISGGKISFWFTSTWSFQSDPWSNSVCLWLGLLVCCCVDPAFTKRFEMCGTFRQEIFYSDWL